MGDDIFIPDDVRSLIDDLTLQVSCPNYVKTPNFKKNISKSDWNAVRNFKPTLIKKDESNKDKFINTLRLLINKITNETYSELFVKIIELISINKNDINDIDKILFDQLCKNSIYSELYAKLYKLILDEIPSIKDYLNIVIEKYKESLININYSNENDNYDMFCKYNQDNNNRKTITSLLLNLMKEGVIKKNNIIDIIDLIQGYINENVQIKENSYKIEELSENLYLLVTNCYDKNDDMDLWDNIIGNINIVCESNKKDFIGLTSKIIFKHQDILEFLEKASNE